MFIWLRSTLPQFASYLSSFKTDPSLERTFLCGAIVVVITWCIDQLLNKVRIDFIGS